jgi:predicted DNA-binding ribbon-helix-helix protein
MKKISVLIADRHATSISLEDDFYTALQQIASAQKISLNQLVTQIDNNRKIENLSSAIRLYVLHYYQNLSATPK